MVRLNPGTIIAGTVAIFLSLSGAFLARQFLLRQATPTPPERPVAKVELTTVPVATTDLPVNRVICRGDVGAMTFTKEQLSNRKLPPVYISNATDLMGRIVKRPVKSGAAFSPEDLFPAGTAPTVADDLEPGLRAVTINVSDSGFVDGFAAPGTHVDVLFRLTPGATDPKGRQPASYTIFQNIRVLAVEKASFPGTKLDPPVREPIKVTLEVTPEQAGFKQGTLVNVVVVAAWAFEPRPFHREHPLLRRILNNWKVSSVTTFGSGRPVNARVVGDANLDGNTSNDRLPGVRRNAFTGPDYATTDLRLTRKLRVNDRVRLELVAESFNLFNRDNKRVDVSDDGFLNTAAQFVAYSETIGSGHYPAHFRDSGHFLQANNAYASRQVQVAVKLSF